MDRICQIVADGGVAMNWIWNKLLTKECVVPMIAVIAILVLAVWFLVERNDHLEAENRQLAARQLIIDRAIIEGIQSIHDALPRPVNYVEVGR